MNTARQFMHRGITAMAIGFVLSGCHPHAAPERASWQWRARPMHEARIGDRVVFDLTLEHPAAWSIEWPMPATHAGWRVLEQRTRERALRAGRHRTLRRYEVVSFQAGEHQVFTNAALARLPDGTARAIQPPTNTFTIRTLGLEANADLADFKPPRRLPNRWPHWLTALLIVGAAAILIALLARLLIRRIRRDAPPPPPIPPDAVALTALDALEKRGDLETGRYEPFYVTLTEIVRHYLEGRFNLRAPEQTTEEFMQAALRAPALVSRHQTQLGAFLAEADLVKFARAAPDLHQMRMAFAQARTFVLETRPPIPVAANDSETSS